MPIYQAPVAEVLFLLRDVFGIQRFSNHPAFGDLQPDTLEAILTAGGRLAEDVLLPLNQVGDREGCRWSEAAVETPKGFKQAYAAYCDGGWQGLASDPAYGGQGLPQLLGAAVNEFCISANMAFTMYPGLTKSAVSALLAHGSEEQKQLYLPKMIAGEWSGTMNLTEPHCGTDLGLLKTRAAPQSDGSFRITGQKIFISAGEHDLSDNIVHLVLARIEGAPAGTKGISLFVVPKKVVNADGSLGPRNGVSCGSIERKMGIHGNATCVMNYDEASGWLVGEANRGLNAMFVMMNEARLGVANQGLALSEIAYQNAAAYAKQRLQGRALSGRSGDGPADPIIVHPDVRRMLLEIRAFNEGARALLLWTALQADVAQGGDTGAAQQADDLLGLLTPVLKGVLTDRGFENCVTAQQVLGGHGYIAEWGLEQFVRDARIAMIYEGANGIQALDLVGRKLPKDGGRAYMRFTGEIAAALKTHAGNEALKPFVEPLTAASAHLQQAVTFFMNKGLADPNQAAAGSHDFMHLLGLVALGFMWLQMAEAALRRQVDDPDTQDAMASKLVVGRFFMERLLPETAAHLARITAGSETVMALPAEAF
jgi:acyl-CoA dehydrogenase